MNLVSAESERTCIALTEPDIRARTSSNLSTWLAVVPMSVASGPYNNGNCSSQSSLVTLILDTNGYEVSIESSAASILGYQDPI
jgi:hypothetical protein